MFITSGNKVCVHRQGMMIGNEPKNFFNNWETNVNVVKIAIIKQLF